MGIAIHYSQALDAGPLAVGQRPVCAEMDAAQRRGSWQPFHRRSQRLDQADEDLGLQYEFVGARQIEEGKLTRNEYRCSSCRSRWP